MIWIVLLGIAVAAIALLLVPLWRRSESAQSRAAFDAQIYRDQLAEIELDAERERITPEQAASARAEIARRLLAATSAENSSGEQPAQAPAARRGVAILVACAVPVAAFGVYAMIGSPDLPGRPAAEVMAQRSAADGRAHDASGGNGAALVAQLGERLKDRPNDLRGWTLYAQSLARLGRFDAAVAAYSRVTALAPRNAELMSRMAEAQIFAARGSVTPAARASLEATLALDAKEPRARFYLGLAELQAGKPDAALGTWIALEADSGPNAPWRAVLADRIAKLAAHSKITADELAARRKAAAAKAGGTAAPPRQTARQLPGPSAEDVRAAQSMPQNDRMAMIRSMVARLAERLKEQPDDIPGWQRLARSYDVLGEPEKAREAYGQLARLQPDDIGALTAYANAIGRTLADKSSVPPELAALGDKILKLDPNHVGALWYTGLALANAGDKQGARQRWTHLLNVLGPDNPQYADVKKNLDALGAKP